MRLGLVLTSWLLVLGVARGATNDRVAVAAFRVLGGSLADVARTRLQASLRGGLAAAGFDVVSEGRVQQTLTQLPGLNGCDTTACMKKLAEQVGVGRVVKATIEMIGSSNYAITLQMLDARDGKLMAQVDDVCQVCTLNEANDALSNAAAALKRKLPPEATQPSTAVEPQPSNATGNGSVAGGSPGAAVTNPPPPTRQPNERRVWRIAAYSVGAAGIVALAAGIPLIAIDGNVRGFSTETGTGRVVVDTYTTLGGGVALTVLGVAALGTAGYLLYRDMRRPPRLALLPYAGFNSVGLAVGGRF